MYCDVFETGVAYLQKTEHWHQPHELWVAWQCPHDLHWQLPSEVYSPLWYPGPPHLHAWQAAPDKNIEAINCSLIINIRDSTCLMWVWIKILYTTPQDKKQVSAQLTNGAVPGCYFPHLSIIPSKPFFKGNICLHQAKEIWVQLSMTIWIPQTSEITVSLKYVLKFDEKNICLALLGNLPYYIYIASYFSFNCCLHDKYDEDS